PGELGRIRADGGGGGERAPPEKGAGAGTARIWLDAVGDDVRRPPASRVRREAEHGPGVCRTDGRLHREALARIVGDRGRLELGGQAEEDGAPRRRALRHRAGPRACPRGPHDGPFERREHERREREGDERLEQRHPAPPHRTTTARPRPKLTVSASRRPSASNRSSRASRSLGNTIVAASPITASVTNTSRRVNAAGIRDVCRARLRRARHAPSTRSVRAITREPRAAASGDGGPGAAEERRPRSGRAPDGPPVSTVSIHNIAKLALGSTDP